MTETLQQLGGLLLGAIPTLVIFLLSFAAYRFILHGPLTHALEQRHSLTVGAVEKAKADVAAAEAKTSEYEQRLREAKLAIFKAQESRRQQAMQARASVVQEARARATQMIAEARQAIEKDVAVAKSALLPETERLAREVIQTILKPAAGAQRPAGGAQ